MPHLVGQQVADYAEYIEEHHDNDCDASNVEIEGGSVRTGIPACQHSQCWFT